MNRPQKLGEKLSELYDNEWTDAFEDIRDTKNLDEKSIVQKLLEIFKVCFFLCICQVISRILAYTHVVNQANLAVNLNSTFFCFSLPVIDLNQSTVCLS